MKPKLLLVELWGLGDLTFATTLLQAALPSYEVYVLGKPHAAKLLGEKFPEVHFIDFDAPWTAFRRKYHLWKWPWRRIWSVLRELRKNRFDAAVSVRRDPRDHLLMRLAGASRRIGFPAKYSYGLLTDVATDSVTPRHRVEDWRQLAGLLGVSSDLSPSLSLKQKADGASPRQRPLIILHAGARIPTRRWPEGFFVDVVRQLRELFQFELIVIPDPDGYGSGLAHVADATKSNLTLTELVSLLTEADLLICNDSGPMHIAAAVGTPTISFFGPTDPKVFRPWGENHKVVERDLCVYRPCFDYCHFAEPYCLTRLRPELVWPEIREHVAKLISKDILPRLPVQHTVRSGST